MFNHNKPERGPTNQLFFYTARKSHVSPGEEELAEKKEQITDNANKTEFLEVLIVMKHRGLIK